MKVVPPKHGKVAHDLGGFALPLTVLESVAGFYLGTRTVEGPFTRESKEYWPTREAASTALEVGQWTQRLSL